jgi:hypothetical protein
MTSLGDWKKEANIQFHTTKEIKEYQLKVKNNPEWRKHEQTWVDTNITPLIDFFGNDGNWKRVLKTNNVKFSGIDTRTTACVVKNAGVATHTADAVYEGNVNGGHWYSRKKGQTDFFNSYDEYQILGTNIWCQTFALMNVTNRLPNRYPKRTLCKYYYYNYYALLFIKECIDNITKRKDLQNAIQQCLRFPNICINAIEIDFNTASIINDKGTPSQDNHKIKTDFETIKKESPERETIEKNDAQFFSIKELKNMFKIKNRPFQSSWKKMDYIQNFKST